MARLPGASRCCRCRSWIEHDSDALASRQCRHPCIRVEYFCCLFPGAPCLLAVYPGCSDCSLALALLQFSYAVPLFLRVTLARDTFRPGPFHLGWWSVPVFWVATLWLTLTGIVFLWPQRSPTTPLNNNWTVVILAVIAAFLGLGWFAVLRRSFLGPHRRSEDMVSARGPIYASSRGTVVSDAYELSSGMAAATEGSRTSTVPLYPRAVEGGASQSLHLPVRALVSSLPALEPPVQPTNDRIVMTGHVVPSSASLGRDPRFGLGMDRTASSDPDVRQQVRTHGSLTHQLGDFSIDTSGAENSTVDAVAGISHAEVSLTVIAMRPALTRARDGHS